MDEQHLVLITLLDLKGFGVKTVMNLMPLFKNEIPDSPEMLYETIKNQNNIQKEEIFEAWNNAIEILKKAYDNEIEIISILDKDFPVLLKEIPDCPPVLYLKGNKKLLNKKSIAIIGSRNHSQKGKEIASMYTKKLVELGFVIVSGLANGIDTIAHTTTLEAKGETIAIIPCSLDLIYPKENISLANEIINSNGLLISEYPFGTKLGKYSFVQRDRLQSGLSLGTFVVETTKEGGSMQTSKYTLKQNRKLFVFSYENLNEYNSGNFDLLKNNNVIPVLNIDSFEIISIKEKKLEKSKTGLNKYF